MHSYRLNFQYLGYYRFTSQNKPFFASFFFKLICQKSIIIFSKIQANSQYTTFPTIISLNGFKIFNVSLAHFSRKNNCKLQIIKNFKNTCNWIELIH